MVRIPPQAPSPVTGLHSSSLGTPIPKCASYPHLVEDNLAKSGLTRRYLLIKAPPDDASFLSLQTQASDCQLIGGRHDSAATASLLEEVCAQLRGEGRSARR